MPPLGSCGTASAKVEPFGTRGLAGLAGGRRSDTRDFDVLLHHKSGLADGRLLGS